MKKQNQKFVFFLTVFLMLVMACAVSAQESTDADTGKTGKWMQFSISQVQLDENGQAQLTLEMPENVTRADIEVWDYLSGSEKLDKSGVELIQAWF